MRVDTLVRNVEEICELIRDGARRSGGRLAYDCFNCKIIGSEVYCVVAGIDLIPVNGDKGNGSASIAQVLAGDKPEVCQKCFEFDDKN